MRNSQHEHYSRDGTSGLAFMSASGLQAPEPKLVFQILTSPSFPAEAKRVHFPDAARWSGSQHREVIHCLWPVNVRPSLEKQPTHFRIPYEDLASLAA
ncbi:hypothetical protein E2C01_030293 [Portunus trituberculatus]|uniref:Uncharacterized protein n=1 Tax=Portunus trituberculatus TaxID=210409 RepID=A0A5B7ETV4_PORTR|nr:hypothetical protein [Portunus trituberculatus]